MKIGKITRDILKWRIEQMREDDPLPFELWDLGIFSGSPTDGLVKINPELSKKLNAQGIESLTLTKENLCGLVEMCDGK